MFDRWKLPVIVWLCLSFHPRLAAAPITIDFENLASQFILCDPNNPSCNPQPMGTAAYPGLDFESNVFGVRTGVSTTWNFTAYPPHSPITGITDPLDSQISIAFTNLPSSLIQIWYTSLDGVTMSVFDQNNNLINTSFGAPNTDGSNGVSNVLEFTGGPIGSVTFTTDQPNTLLLDDLTFMPVPEAAPGLMVLSGLLALLGWGSRRQAPKNRAPQ
jgi:hypothetical protein